MTEWLEYFVYGLHTQMIEIQEKGRKIVSAEKSVKFLKDYKLNLRQERIIRYLIINERIDNEQCQKLCKTIKRTATRDVSLLVEKQIIERKGEKRGTFYILASKILEQLRDKKRQH